MKEIVSGFTKISAGTDPISTPAANHPTGVRITVEFCRDAALSPGETVCARYEHGGDGRSRTVTGVAQPTRTVRSGGEVSFHYRISQWMKPGQLVTA